MAFICDYDTIYDRNLKYRINMLPRAEHMIDSEIRLKKRYKLKSLLKMKIKNLRGGSKPLRKLDKHVTFAHDNLPSTSTEEPTTSYREGASVVVERSAHLDKLDNATNQQPATFKINQTIPKVIDDKQERSVEPDDVSEDERDVVDNARVPDADNNYSDITRSDLTSALLNVIRQDNEDNVTEDDAKDLPDIVLDKLVVALNEKSQDALAKVLGTYNIINNTYLLDTLYEKCRNEALKEVMSRLRKNTIHVNVQISYKEQTMLAKVFPEFNLDFSVKSVYNSHGCANIVRRIFDFKMRNSVPLAPMDQVSFKYIGGKRSMLLTQPGHVHVCRHRELNYDLRDNKRDIDDSIAISAAKADVSSPANMKQNLLDKTLKHKLTYCSVKAQNCSIKSNFVVGTDVCYDMTTQDMADIMQAANAMVGMFSIAYDPQIMFTTSATMRGTQFVYNKYTEKNVKKIRFRFNDCDFDYVHDYRTYISKFMTNVYITTDKKQAFMPSFDYRKEVAYCVITLTPTGNHSNVRLYRSIPMAPDTQYVGVPVYDYNLNKVSTSRFLHITCKIEWHPKWLIEKITSYCLTLNDDRFDIKGVNSAIAAFAQRKIIPDNNSDEMNDYMANLSSDSLYKMAVTIYGNCFKNKYKAGVVTKLMIDTFKEKIKRSHRNFFGNLWGNMVYAFRKLIRKLTEMQQTILMDYICTDIVFGDKQYWTVDEYITTYGRDMNDFDFDFISERNIEINDLLKKFVEHPDNLNDNRDLKTIDLPRDYFMNFTKLDTINNNDTCLYQTILLGLNDYTTISAFKNFLLSKPIEGNSQSRATVVEMLTNNVKANSLVVTHIVSALRMNIAVHLTDDEGHEYNFVVGNYKSVLHVDLSAEHYSPTFRTSLDSTSLKPINITAIDNGILNYDKIVSTAIEKNSFIAQNSLITKKQIGITNIVVDNKIDKKLLREVKKLLRTESNSSIYHFISPMELNFTDAATMAIVSVLNGMDIDNVIIMDNQNELLSNTNVYKAKNLITNVSTNYTLIDSDVYQVQPFCDDALYLFSSKHLAQKVYVITDYKNFDLHTLYKYIKNGDCALFLLCEQQFADLYDQCKNFSYTVYDSVFFSVTDTRFLVLAKLADSKISLDTMLTGIRTTLCKRIIKTMELDANCGNRNADDETKRYTIASIFMPRVRFDLPEKRVYNFDEDYRYEIEDNVTPSLYTIPYVYDKLKRKLVTKHIQHPHNPNKLITRRNNMYIVRRAVKGTRNKLRTTCNGLYHGGAVVGGIMSNFYLRCYNKHPNSVKPGNYYLNFAVDLEGKLTLNKFSEGNRVLTSVTTTQDTIMAVNRFILNVPNDAKEFELKVRMDNNKVTLRIIEIYNEVTQQKVILNCGLAKLVEEYNNSNLYNSGSLLDFDDTPLTINDYDSLTEAALKESGNKYESLFDLGEDIEDSVCEDFAEQTLQELENQLITLEEALPTTSTATNVICKEEIKEEISPPEDKIEPAMVVDEEDSTDQQFDKSHLAKLINMVENNTKNIMAIDAALNNIRDMLLPMKTSGGSKPSTSDILKKAPRELIESVLDDLVNSSDVKVRKQVLAYAKRHIKNFEEKYDIDDLSYTPLRQVTTDVRDIEMLDNRGKVVLGHSGFHVEKNETSYNMAGYSSQLLSSMVNSYKPRFVEETTMEHVRINSIREYIAATFVSLQCMLVRGKYLFSHVKNNLFRHDSRNIVNVYLANNLLSGKNEDTYTHRLYVENDTVKIVPFDTFINGFSITFKELQVFSEFAIYSQIVCYNNVRKLPFTIILEQGVPGSGKTTRLLTSQKRGDLVLFSTKEGRLDFINRVIRTEFFKGDGDKTINAYCKVHFRTINSYVINGTSRHERVFVDEALMTAPGMLFVVALKASAKFLILQGDTLQIPFINRHPIIVQNYTNLSKMVKASTVYNVSYRVPRKIARYLSPWYEESGYPKFTTTNQNEGEFFLEKFNSINPLITKIKSTKPNIVLTFTQAEKQEVIDACKQMSLKIDVNTIHEYQGKQSEHVCIVRLKVFANETIYDSRPHIVVGLSRHTKSLSYYTKFKQDDGLTRAYRTIEMYGGFMNYTTDKVVVREPGGVLTNDSILRLRRKDILKDGSFNKEALTRKFLNKTDIGIAYGDVKRYPKLPSYLRSVFPKTNIKLVKSGLTSDEKEKIEDYNKQMTIMYSPSIEVHKQWHYPVNLIQYKHQPIKAELEILQIIHDITFPLDVRVDQTLDNHILNTMHLNLAFEQIAYCEIKGLPKDSPFQCLKPRLKTTCSPPMQLDLVSLMRCVYKRNAAVPKIQETSIDAKSTAEMLKDIFFETYCTTTTPFEETRCDMESVKNWLRQRDGTVLPELGETENIGFVDLKAYQLDIKRSTKPVLTNGCTDEAPVAQTIVHQGKKTNLMFCALFQIMTNRLLSILKPNVHINTSMDIEELAKRLDEHLLDSMGCHSLEIDFSKFDKSQGELPFEFECLIYEFLGMPRDYLELWREMHRTSKLRALAFKLSINIQFQRRSGAANTLVGNSLFTMVSVASYYDLRLAKWIIIVGDDILAMLPHKPNDASPYFARMFNLESKLLQHQKSYYFCSKFVIPTPYGYIIVPDPVKLLVKLGRHDIKNFYHMEEYITALKDSVKTYAAQGIDDLLNEAVKDRYPNAVDNLHRILYEFINSDKVRELFYHSGEKPLYPSSSLFEKF